MRYAMILAAVVPFLALVAAQAFGWPELAASGALWAMVPPASLGNTSHQGELVAEDNAGAGNEDADSPANEDGSTDADSGADEGDKGKGKRPRVTVIKARVLFTGIYGMVNTVATVSPATLKAGVAAGELDPHKDAVAYAEALATGQAAG